MNRTVGFSIYSFLAVYSLFVAIKVKGVSKSGRMVYLYAGTVMTIYVLLEIRIFRITGLPDEYIVAFFLIVIVIVWLYLLLRIRRLKKGECREKQE